METVHEISDGPIKATMTIGDVIQVVPESIPIMLKYGLHCVGCSAATWETLEQGAMGHGMSQDVFGKMLGEINELVKKEAEKPKEQVEQTITITQAAAKKVIAMAKEEGRANAILRVSVVPGGCAGFKYDMDFVDLPDADDFVIEAHGIKAVLNKSSMEAIAGSTLDYIETIKESGFKITNPKFTQSCACGDSFR